jgi:hypothetical protein
LINDIQYRAGCGGICKLFGLPGDRPTAILPPVHWLAAVAAALAAGAPAAPSPPAAPVRAAAPVRGTAPIVRPGGVRAARRFARARAGTVSFAVIGGGTGLRGLRQGRHQPSASLSKAMVLAAVLRAARDRPLTGAERALLGPMVTRSDNDAAIAAYALVGPPGMLDVARAAGMRSFVDVGHWSDAQVTAADQARLFWRLDHVLPPRHRAYARRLLAGIVPPQRWGLAPVAERRGLRVLFKGGWRRGLTHQAARLERGGRHAALAVLIAGGPKGAYDRATIAGIARRVLAGGPRHPPRIPSRTA